MARFILPVACIALCSAAATVQAQPAASASPSAQPVQGPTEGNSPGAPAARGAAPSGATNAGENAERPFAANLLGDPGGLRSKLAGYGISLGLTEIDEVLGNPTGGIKRGAAYEGLTQLGLGLDTQKLFGLEGGTFNVSAYHFHGHGLTSGNLAALSPVSSIEQDTPGAKLFELWYEQVLLNKKLAIRIGQMAADQEFILTEYGGLFINAGYGFPTLPAVVLPSGGPSYPLATPGIRLKYVPDESFALLAAAFNGDPAGPGTSDPQKRDGAGTAFRLNDGVFAIAELQYSLNAGDNAAGLPGTYKLGAWYNSQPFADQRFSFTGQSLADPSNTAAARTRRGDYSVYAIADQLVWRKPDTKDGGIGVFARAMGAPPDRNLIDVFVQGGVTYKAPFAGRENDTVGLAVSWAHISQRASKLDTDTIAFTGTPMPVRRAETQIELTYQAQLAAWFQLQPNLQYLFKPGGGLPSPRTGKRIGDAAILGLRSTVTF